MRWFWIDRFVEFVSGQRAVAIKAVSLGEDHMHDLVPAHPTMPATLIVEGLAQTGGLLVGEHNEFRERVILAKIGKVQFYFHPRPGDILTYTAVIESIQHDGAVVRGTSYVGDRLQAEIDLCFAHLDERFADKPLFKPNELLGMLRAFDLWKIGVDQQGNRLTEPEYMVEAERATVAVQNQQLA